MTEQRELVPQQGAGMTLGQQQLDPGDIIPPRVKIVQQMSDEAQGKAGERRAEPGDWWNTLTQENLGDTLQIIPILTFKQRVFLVRQERRDKADEMLTAAGLEPLSEGDGLKCRSFDMLQGLGEPGVACHDCPLSRWVGNVPPLCSETYNVAALTTDGELVITSFAKSSAKTGKRLFSMLRMTTAKPWSKILTLTSRQEKNDQGTFFVADVVPSADRPAPELMGQAEFWNRELGGRQSIDVTPEDELEDDPEEVPVGTRDF